MVDLIFKAENDKVPPRNLMADVESNKDAKTERFLLSDFPSVQVKWPN